MNYKNNITQLKFYIFKLFNKMNFVYLTRILLIYFHGGVNFATLIGNILASLVRLRRPVPIHISS